MHGPLQDDALPTSREQITASLAQRATAQEPMLIPVTSQYYLKVQHGGDRTAFERLGRADGSEIPAAMTTLLRVAPRDYKSELTTTVAVSHYFDTVFDTLNLYSTLKLEYDCSLNTKEQCTTSSCVQGRPDTVIVVNGCTLMIGEDKREGSMIDAIGDIKKKVMGLNIHHYGSVQFLLAYAAAGLRVQFFMVSANGTQVQACHT
jgi:hypothetical protein